MLRIIWHLSVHIRNALHRYAPTDMLSDAVRSGRLPPRWGALAMLLAVPYLGGAYLCTHVIDDGGPRWLYAVIVLLIWNAMKMLWLGPVTIALVIRAKFLSARANRR